MIASLHGNFRNNGKTHGPPTGASVHRVDRISLPWKNDNISFWFVTEAGPIAQTAAYADQFASHTPGFTVAWLSEMPFRLGKNGETSEQFRKHRVLPYEH